MLAWLRAAPEWAHVLLSSEDVCKRRLTEMFYLGGGIAVGNLTSKAWNKEQGC